MNSMHPDKKSYCNYFLISKPKHVLGTQKNRLHEYQKHNIYYVLTDIQEHIAILRYILGLVLSYGRGWNLQDRSTGLLKHACVPEERCLQSNLSMTKLIEGGMLLMVSIWIFAIKQ